MTSPSRSPEIDRSAAADLAFLKAVAAAGRGRPAPAVPLMAVFGLVYGLTELVLWFEIMLLNGGRLFDGRPAPGPWDTVNAVMFLGAHAIFLATLAWTAWRVFQTRGAGMNRGAAAAWTAAFAGLLITIAAIVLISLATQMRGDPNGGVTYLLSPVLLTLWAGAWWVTSVVTGRRWLGLVAVGSLAAALLTAWFAGTAVWVLLCALCLLLLAFLPAAILMRRPQAG